MANIGFDIIVIAGACVLVDALCVEGDQHTSSRWVPACVDLRCCFVAPVISVLVVVAVVVVWNLLVVAVVCVGCRTLLLEARCSHVMSVL